MIAQNKTKKNKISFYTALLFIAIYFSHDTLLFGTNSNDVSIIIRKAVPFLIIIIFLLYKPFLKVERNKLLLTALVVLLPFISCFVNNEQYANYIYRAAIMLAAALFVLNEKEGEFQQSFTAIMQFLSIWSLIIFAIGNLFSQVISFLPTVTNSAGHQFINTIFTVFYIGNSRYSFSRNYGIFREPGVFMIFIALALLIEFSQTDKRRWKNIILLTITMLSTGSTAGYIVLAGIYFYSFLSEREHKHKGIISVIAISAMVLLVMSTNLLSNDSAMLQKFQYGTNAYGSWYARLSSLVENVRLAVQNPLFGVGRYSLYSTVLGSDTIYSAVDNTNTFLINFSAYGLLYGFTNLCGLWRYCKLTIGNKKFMLNLFLVLLFFAAFSNEDMGQNIVYYILIFKGLYTFTKLNRL